MSTPPSNPQSETARTDALQKRHLSNAACCLETLDFARQLERELSEANDRLLKWIESPAGDLYVARQKLEQCERQCKEQEKQLTQPLPPEVVEAVKYFESRLEAHAPQLQTLLTHIKKGQQ